MKVIFVCTGNTCRSPLAEGYLKSKNIPWLTVESRGIFASGEAVSANSAAAAKEYGIDISHHISKQLTKDDLASDMFFCMSESHKNALISAGAPENKVYVLSNGIPDPFGGDIEDYRICRDSIFKAIDELLQEDFFGDTSITTASYNDISAIALLESECFSQPWSQKAIRESMDAGTLFIVFRNSDRVIGYIGISIIADEGYITNIAVSAAYRKTGVATAILRHIFSLAKEKQLSFVTLEVRGSNIAAISLYEKFGFKKEGLRKNFYSFPKEDAIIMTKRFDRTDEHLKH